MSYGHYTDRLAGRERITGVKYDLVIDQPDDERDDLQVFIVGTDKDPGADTPEWNITIGEDRLAAIAEGFEALRFYEKEA